MNTQLGFIGIVTSDMAATLGFYRTLGLQVPQGAEKEIHVDIELGNGLQLAFDTFEVVQMSDPDFVFPTGPTRSALAFRFDTPAEVDAKATEMIAAGHQVLSAPFDAFWGQRYASIADPDGNQVDLFSPLA